jgi:hypothetical protein
VNGTGTPAYMPKAGGENIGGSNEPPKKMPNPPPVKGGGSTGIEPPAGGITGAPVSTPTVTPDLTAPAIPNVPADLDRKEPF